MIERLRLVVPSLLALLGQVRGGSCALPSSPLQEEEARAAAPCEAPPSGLLVRGDAFDFSPSGGRVPGAEVRSLEHPERCAVTAEDGSFSLGGFVPGEPVTLVMEKPGFAPIQTGTLTMPREGLDRVTFQAPTWGIYRLTAAAALAWPAGDRCQIATTVTEHGRSLYDDVPSHGEAGATVTMDPMPSGVVGPIYFQYVGPRFILPGRWLTETTRDGGVLFLNAPPGEYTLTAHKAGVRFTQARIRCRAGWLVNASPPWGIQALP